MQHNPHGLEIFSKHRHIHQGIVDRQPQVATQAIQSHLMASKERVIREIQTLQITALLNPITNCPPHEVGQALDNPAPAGERAKNLVPSPVSYCAYASLCHLVSVGFSL